MRSVILTLAAFVAAATAGRLGFDGIQAISTATFECLRKDNFIFFVGRVGTELGGIDNTGIQNIKNARAAGWTDVAGYIYPCISSRCASAATQVANVHNALKAHGTDAAMLWMDIEGTWGSNTAWNREFITGLVNEAKNLGYMVGIYSGQYAWPPITGSWTGMSHLPLWWPNYNGSPSFNNFPHYGGWTKPEIHQYKGTTNGGCGVSMDLNYKNY